MTTEFYRLINFRAVAIIAEGEIMSNHSSARSIILLFCLGLLFLVTGCGGDGDGSVETSDGIADTIDSTVTIDASVTEGDAPLEVRFSAKSDDLVLSQLWNFGDGDTAETINPNSSVKHTYTEGGTYTVSLVTATNLGGQQSDTIEITVGQVIAFPVARVTLINNLPEETLVKVVGDSSAGDIDFNFTLYDTVTGEPTLALGPGKWGYIEVKCDVNWELDVTFTDADGANARLDQIGMQLYLCGVGYEWEFFEL
jgi:PKD repeat protein